MSLKSLCSDNTLSTSFTCMNILICTPCTLTFIFNITLYSWAFLVAQLIKNPPAMREAWVRSLGWEDTLEKGTATHSSILAWRIPWIHGLYSPWGSKESDMTKQFSLTRSLKETQVSFIVIGPCLGKEKKKIGLNINLLQGSKDSFITSCCF